MLWAKPVSQNVLRQKTCNQKWEWRHKKWFNPFMLKDDKGDGLCYYATDATCWWKSRMRLILFDEHQQHDKWSELNWDGCQKGVYSHTNGNVQLLCREHGTFLAPSFGSSSYTGLSDNWKKVQFHLILFTWLESNMHRKMTPTKCLATCFQFVFTPKRWFNAAVRRKERREELVTHLKDKFLGRQCGFQLKLENNERRHPYMFYFYFEK